MTPESAHIIAAALNHVGDMFDIAAKTLAGAIFTAAVICAVFNK